MYQNRTNDQARKGHSQSKRKKNTKTIQKEEKSDKNKEKQIEHIKQNVSRDQMRAIVVSNMFFLC